MTTFNKTRYP